MKEILIESFSLVEINEKKRERFNSNNHWVDDDSEYVKPTDYEEICEKCDTSYWIDKFKSTYSVINIDLSDVNWLKSAATAYRITERMDSFKEDLKDFLEKYEPLTKRFFDRQEKYFVKANHFSLKTGVHGVGPYSDLKKIMESIITSDDKHTPVPPTATKLKIYLMPWENVSLKREFRVFVYDNQITGVSQQDIYSTHLLQEGVSQEVLEEQYKKWVHVIYQYFHNTIKKKITHISTFSMDIAILDNGKPYFIEINPFGKLYSAGSALFHWVIDEHLLLNQNDVIYFRYTKN
ncbi:hypothetical protein DLAC_10967 [Tieghemostelium lacteum]|uniref:Cell division cycle protein 123 n=1 Tax=Tieghemostelium lacteum TaxID=361077 RepID=A0A151Z2U3_TIELA|nr:hypothetical protein DLAC_10967 [Tieghemostelium lacteum]|eukprot:KYQ88276.1 hypothetical protein DLAC_10967 [Tieghemostelium lacteum]